MQPPCKLGGKGVINHAMALNPGFTREGGGNNVYPKVGLPAGLSAGVASVAGAFIL